MVLFNILTGWKPDQSRTRFYSAKVRPDPRVIKYLIDIDFRYFSKKWTRIRLLEDALQYDYVEDWRIWTRLLRVHGIPLKMYRNCLIMAAVKDYLSVFKWISKYWKFTSDTAMAYQKLATLAGSTEVKAFLEKKYRLMAGEVFEDDGAEYMSLIDIVKDNKSVNEASNVPADLTPVSKDNVLKTIPRCLCVLLTLPRHIRFQALRIPHDQYRCSFGVA